MSLLQEYIDNQYRYTIDITMEIALRRRFYGEGMRITVMNSVATFEGNTKYSEEELKAIIEEVKQGKLTK